MHTVRDGTQACARTHAYRQWSDFPRCLIWFMSSWRGTRDNKEREGIDSRCSSSLQFLPVPSHTNLTALSQPRELFCKSYSAHLPWKKSYWKSFSCCFRSRNMPCWNTSDCSTTRSIYVRQSLCDVITIIVCSSVNLTRSRFVRKHDTVYLKHADLQWMDSMDSSLSSRVTALFHCSDQALRPMLLSWWMPNMHFLTYWEYDKGWLI